MYNIILGIAILPCFLFALKLIWTSNSDNPNKFLGYFVLFISFYILWIIKYDYGLNEKSRFLQFLPILFLWGIGPAFYAYSRSLLKKPIPKKELKWHFLPVFVEVLFSSITLLLWIFNDWNAQKLNAFEQFWIQYDNSIDQLIGMISIGFYITKSFKLLQENYLFDDSYNRIRNLFILFSLVWGSWVSYSIMDAYHYHYYFPPSMFYLFYIILTILIYSIGFYGYKTTGVITDKMELLNNNDRITKREIDPVMQASAIKIRDYMVDNECYLDPNLKLKTFADELNMHPNQVSGIINTVLKQSFREFVNTHRVQRFKDKLKEYDVKEHTIIGLAYEVGFNSKASFNRIFKEFENISPKEYINKIEGIIP